MASTSRVARSGSTPITTGCARCLKQHGMELQGEGQQWTTIRRWLHRDGRLQSPTDLGPEVYRQLDAFEAIVHDAAEAVDDPANPQRCFVRRGARCDLAGRRGESGWARRAGAAVPSSRQPGRVRRRARARSRCCSSPSSERSARLVVPTTSSARIESWTGSARSRNEWRPSVADAITTNEIVARRSARRRARSPSRPRVVACEVDHVVLACSLVPLRGVRFDPPLPDAACNVRSTSSATAR